MTADIAPAPPKTLEDVATFASWLAHASVTGVLDARSCREASYALSQLRFTLEKLHLAAELRDLRDRVKRLEKS